MPEKLKKHIILNKNVNIKLKIKKNTLKIKKENAKFLVFLGTSVETPVETPVETSGVGLTQSQEHYVLHKMILEA